MPQPNLNVQIICVQREIAMRERVYPRWVEAGKMTQKKADAELETMRAVKDTLQDLLTNKEFELEG